MRKNLTNWITKCNQLNLQLFMNYGAMMAKRMVYLFIYFIYGSFKVNVDIAHSGSGLAKHFLMNVQANVET